MKAEFSVPRRWAGMRPPLTKAAALEPPSQGVPFIPRSLPRGSSFSMAEKRSRDESGWFALREVVRWLGPAHAPTVIRLAPQHFLNGWPSTLAKRRDEKAVLLERTTHRQKGSCCAYREDDEGIVVHLLGAQGKRQVGNAAVHHLSAQDIAAILRRMQPRCQRYRGSLLLTLLEECNPDAKICQ